MIRQKPSREPKFHHEEIFDGVGRSMNALLIIFISGCVFRMLVISVLIVEYNDDFSCHWSWLESM